MADDDIAWQRYLGARGDLPRLGREIGLGERLADRLACGEQERIGDAAADDQAIHLLRKRIQDGELRGHFRARDDRHEWPRRFGERLAERVELRRHERPGARHLGVARDAVRGGFRAVRGGKGIVHVHVAERGDLLGERRIILLLALVHPAVLEQHDLSGLHVHPIQPIADERDLVPEQRGEPLGDGRERVLRLELALGGTPEVRGDHHGGTGIEALAYRRHRGADTRVVGNAPVLNRNVQVGADENALAAQVHLGHTTKLHNGSLNFCSATSRARRRLPQRQPRRRACGSRNPTRCRTTSRPSRACRRTPW